MMGKDLKATFEAEQLESIASQCHTFHVYKINKMFRLCEKMPMPHLRISRINRHRDN